MNCFKIVNSVKLYFYQKLDALGFFLYDIAGADLNKLFFLKSVFCLCKFVKKNPHNLLMCRKLKLFKQE